MFKCLLGVRHYYKGFIRSNLFNLHNISMRVLSSYKGKYCYPHFTDEEAVARGGSDIPNLT